jgi:hypothetical protein
MTDDKFLDLTEQAGDGGRFHFTFPQLYGAWCGREAEENFFLLLMRLAIVGTVLLFVFVFFFSVFSWAVGLLSMLLLIIPWRMSKKYQSQPPPESGALKKMVKQWRAVNGVPDMMLIKPSLHESPPDFPENDLYDYGVERIIIVERPLLVDLLVKNGFHAEQSALVFSRDGYPSYIFQQAKRLLKENVSLPIYLLHDASEAGLGMYEKNRLSGHILIDLGIRPEHLAMLSVLRPLQLQHKDYKAPLDIIPYPALAAMTATAVADNITLIEVLKNRAEDGKRERLFSFRKFYTFFRHKWHS